METKINTFCNRYHKKLKNDKDIKEVELDYFLDFRERITFNVTEYSFIPNSYRIGLYQGTTLFTLDKEDLKYLYDKYSKKLQEEMNNNIEEIKKLYGN